jgi:hypothetical protein
MIDLTHGCQVINNPLSELLRVGHKPNRNLVEKALVKVHDENPNDSYYEVWMLEKTTDIRDAELIDEKAIFYGTTFTFCCDEYEDAIEFFNNPDISDSDTDSDSDTEFVQTEDA